ncbi:hypothetical protein T4E_3870 [Trichinella pseudospiralis]|uniref:Uncharacterized protein n=1 Tax=Trichinella pseudospiralis TaxID=6337 RepID=A0A0V0XF62_TRIPS|nr:hypothetical protein T4E_3870 [Trichinella pseudospiralis]
MTQLAIMSVSGCSLLPLAVDVVRKEALLLSSGLLALVTYTYYQLRHAGLCSRTRNACLNFLNAIRIRKFLINLRHQSLRKASKYAEVHQSPFWCLQRFPILGRWQSGKLRHG